MKEKEKCCPHCRAPVFAIIVLILAVLWLLSDLNVLVLNIPWLPLIITVIASACIIHHKHKK